MLVTIIMFPRAIEKTFVASSEQYWLDTSSYTRIVILQESLNLVLTEPLLGYGFNRYRVIVSQFYELKHTLFSSAHNLYLRIAVKNGIMGLLAYLWLMKTLLAGTYQLSNRTSDIYVRSIGYGLFAGAVGLLFSNVTQSNLFCDYTAAFFWFFSAASTTLLSQVSVPAKVVDTESNRVGDIN